MKIRSNFMASSVGKTVPSYRMALESKVDRCQGFARSLRVEDGDAFEALTDACKSYASAGSNATIPIIFEPMAISIMLHLQTQTIKLEKEHHDLKQQ